MRLVYPKEINIHRSVPLAQFTSWLVGGPAEFFCQPTTINELIEAVKWALLNKIKITPLGGGSNVLISDSGISGLVINLRRLSGTEIFETKDYILIEALAGTGKSDILKIFLKYKLAPSLFLAGLPGDVAGGVVMNAGVSEQIHPREFGEIVEWIEVLTWKNSDLSLEIKKMTSTEIKWVYRHSSGWGPGIITKVAIKWPNHPVPEILEKVRSANRARLSKQPLDLPSCGSVFKNPEGFKAAQLIDQCGLKGATQGGAQVSMKHANFIVNTGEASAKDLWGLIQKVQSEVLVQKKIELVTEVIRLGDWK